MPNLDIIIGPMFAGKSCELIRRIRILKVLKKNYLVVKPALDNRYDENMVVSHNFDKENCIVVRKLSDILNEDFNNNFDTVFIDEGQFFEDLKEVVIKLVEEYNLNVVITGLDGDSNRNKFGQILDLIPYSTTCVKINACCVMCMDGTSAPFTFRKNNNNNDQILIGAGDMYMSLCRKHYLEGTV